MYSTDVSPIGYVKPGVVKLVTRFARELAETRTGLGFCWSTNSVNENNQMKDSRSFRNSIIFQILCVDVLAPGQVEANIRAMKYLYEKDYCLQFFKGPNTCCLPNDFEGYLRKPEVVESFKRKLNYYYP
jgi:hypothetical protein